MRLGKAAVSLLVLLGISAGGGAIASRIAGDDQPRGQLAAETTLNDSRSDSAVTVNTLLQPCDLGACSAAAETFLVDNTTDVTVFEDVWHVTDPGQTVINSPARPRAAPSLIARMTR